MKAKMISQTKFADGYCEYVYTLQEGVFKDTLHVYTNPEGLIVWAYTKNESKLAWARVLSANRIRRLDGEIIHWQWESVGGFKTFNRTGAETKWLLSHPETAKAFRERFAHHRRSEWVMFPTEEVHQKVFEAFWKVAEAESTRGHAAVGPGRLSIDELRELGAKIAHTPRQPQTGGDYVRKNFNWGAGVPKPGEWMKMEAGFRYHGNKGINPGWVWYEGK